MTLCSAKLTDVDEWKGRNRGEETRGREVGDKYNTMKEGKKKWKEERGERQREKEGQQQNRKRQQRNTQRNTKRNMEV